MRVLYIHFLGANSVSDTGYANTSGLRLVFLLMTRFGAQEFGIRMKSPRSVFPRAGFPAGAACVLSADTVAVTAWPSSAEGVHQPPPPWMPGRIPPGHTFLIR